MNPTVPPSSGRLEAVDALRGFALLAILLLHSLEHYNIFYGNAPRPEWLQMLDTKTTEFLYFLFCRKSVRHILPALRFQFFHTDAQCSPSRLGFPVSFRMANASAGRILPVPCPVL